jgi:hypothetical protein
LLATGLYNAAVAPPASAVVQAAIIPLTGDRTAAATMAVNISDPSPTIGAHFALDKGAKAIVPLDGRPAFAVEMGVASEAVADGDCFVWLERGSPSVVKYYDVPHGLLRSIALTAKLEPAPHTLSAGGGLVAWTYLTDRGNAALAGFFRGPDLVATYTIPRVANATAVAAARGDIFFATTLEPTQDLWVYNVSRGQAEVIARGPGVSSVSVGRFFAVWVNGSASQSEYFDLDGRVVRPLPTPEGVVPRWALADNMTVLIGGLKQGLLFASPRVEFYDFATGSSHIYDSVGVDFDATPYFGYGDRVVVTVESHRLTRPQAPLTPFLLGIVAISTAATALLAARELGRPGA